MPTVYIETSIPSYYFETRGEPRVVAWHLATRQWWDELSGGHVLVTSGTTIEELSKAPVEKARLMRELLAPVALLRHQPIVDEVAAYYAEHRLVPAATLADALHLAYASVHRVEYLLTWNCQHLANPNKARHLTVLNARSACPCLPL